VKTKTEPTLRIRAMRMLARREYSRAELRSRLLPHAQPDEDVETVLEALEARGWLSDARAAEQMLQTRRSRFGSQRIAHEMRQKGIGEGLIAEALPQLREGELEAARTVWQKKFGSEPADAKEKARQVRFLQSRGFGLDTIFKVIRSTAEFEQE
jgi:regulatory protein